MIHLHAIWPVVAALLLATPVLGGIHRNTGYKGTYKVFSCDNQATAIVKGLLVQMTPMLEGAIRDASTGSNSEFGYTAIFKDPASVPYIKTMLQNMADGSKMPVQTKDWPGDRSPIFICARPGNRDPSMNQFSSACTSEQTPAVRIPDSPWIVLCPTFFRMKEAPERTDCPTEDSRGLMFLPNTMIGNQYTALIRQLAHFYLGPDNLPVEVTNLNQIFSLSADETKRNARSYEFYVASVQATCSSWPGGPHHRPPPA